MARYDRRCCFEDGVSGEVIMRLRANPRLHAALETLPPKLLALCADAPPAAITLAEELEGRVGRVEARIERATFTGAGDKLRVPALYKEYVETVVRALQPLLAIGAVQAVERLPTMADDTTDATSLLPWAANLYPAVRAR